jgi:phage gp37-like protein
VGVIASVEDALIAAVTAALPVDTARVESLPGDWDDVLFELAPRQAPVVFVAFLGGPPLSAQAGFEATIDSRWAVIAATNHASGELARRRGDAVQLGAYELLERIVPRLHGLPVADAGSMRLAGAGITNLYSGSVDGQGLAVYAVELALPLTLELANAPGELTPLAAVSAAVDVPPFDKPRHADWLAGVDTTKSPDVRAVEELPQP